VVEYNGVQYSLDLAVSTEDRPVLGPGECYDYGYEVDVTEFLLGILNANGPEVAESELEMSNFVSAGITNFEGQEDLYFVNDEAEVMLPEPNMEYIDETATLTDLETFPDGFDMDIVSGPWYLEGADTIRFCKNITNVDAECGGIYYFNDTAKLVEDDTGEIRKDHASVVVETPECDNGITMSVEKTIYYGWNKTTEYDWALEKSVNQTALQLDQGEAGYLNYTFTVTRTAASETESIEVWGTVTVTNNGPVATQGLQVMDVLSMTIEGSSVTIRSEDLTSQKSVLASGETHVYYYSWDITQDILDALGVTEIPQDLNSYEFENLGVAKVTNYVGNPGSVTAVQDIVAFSIATLQQTEVDETAPLTDLFDRPPRGLCHQRDRERTMVSHRQR